MISRTTYQYFLLSLAGNLIENTFRDKSEATDLARFKLQLENVNWTDIVGYVDPSEAYRVFLDKYISLYKKCFPLKKVKVS